MHRLAYFDVSRRFASRLHKLAAQLSFGAACAIVMIAIRSLVDVWAPTSGPFALVYPAVLLATLYGRLLAGAVAYLVSFFWAWWYVLPATRAFQFEIPTDPSRVALNAVTVLVVLVLAETFRRAVERGTQERDREIERREILFTELDHRTKNNFAIIASLLDIQKRRSTGAAKDALVEASGRVHSFASAYSNIPIPDSSGDIVNVKPYLTELIERVSAAAFDDHVTVKSQIAGFSLPRETAAAVGLYLNEALTNCAKHAFPQGRSGTIEVIFAGQDAGWMLSVMDDGVGRSVGDGGKGTGSSLMEAFAQQAAATHTRRLRDKGCSVKLHSKGGPTRAT
jgi:two-component system, sensor histidine kinase PdtaS